MFLDGWYGRHDEVAVLTSFASMNQDMLICVIRVSFRNHLAETESEDIPERVARADQSIARSGCTSRPLDGEAEARQDDERQDVVVEQTLSTCSLHHWNTPSRPPCF